MALFTIGHSTRSLEEFIGLAKKWNVDTIADVRSFPGSKRYPHFNIENLKISLPNNHLNYIHFKDLGGRRKSKDENNLHSAWNEDSFRYYAAYAYSSNEFELALHSLLDQSKANNIAMMCSEAVWWRCHRRIITDYAIANGVVINHIMSMNKCDVAKITPFAKLVQSNKITYPNISNQQNILNE